MKETTLILAVVITFSIGFISGAATPYIMDKVITGVATIDFDLPNDQYPNACINWNYVRGDGSKKSDYYFYTDAEICNKSCYPPEQFNDTETMQGRLYRAECGCCKARGVDGSGVYWRKER
jgi:hypothetical protein